jgi:hypothetical protein
MKTSKKDRATLARLWATSFACLLMNLTWEFTRVVDKIHLHSLIIAPKLETLVFLLVFTSRIGENNYVLVSTKCPWSSLIQTPTSILLRRLEKNTSILHLYRPRDGLDKTIIPLFTCSTGAKLRVYWAFFQLESNMLALLHITWIVSIVLFQTLLFLCFQRLQSITLNISCWLLSNF